MDILSENRYDYWSDMGNVCGCVRGPKEECYIDPKKAPLTPDSKHSKGRRYFQRKKRKVEDLQTHVSPRNPGHASGAVCDTDVQDGAERSPEERKGSLGKPVVVETCPSRRDSTGKGVSVEEEPVLVLGDPSNQHHGVRSTQRLRCSTQELKNDASRCTAEGKLRGINSLSRGLSAKDGLIVKKLLQRQLRRAVSFGAVEHMLQTLRGHDSPGCEETFAKIILDSQAHRRRRRRRSYTCSGSEECLPISYKHVPTHREVNWVPVIYICNSVCDSH